MITAFPHNITDIQLCYVHRVRLASSPQPRSAYTILQLGTVVLVIDSRYLITYV